MNLHLMRVRSRHVGLCLIVAAVAGLSGCGGGGGSSSTPPPVVNADPTGYYDATGTATVGDGSGGTLNITDLQAMVNGTHFIAMSAAQGLVYDGTMTSVTQNSYTATVTIYKNGTMLSSAPASGTITQGSSITGTLTGTGQGNGTFNLTYSLANNQAATLANAQNNASEPWTATVGGSVSTSLGMGFVMDSTGAMTGDNSQIPSDGVFKSCQVASGSIKPIQGLALYSVSITLSNCSTAAADGAYAGLATVLSKSSSNDTLDLAVTNANYSINAEFQRTVNAASGYYDNANTSGGADVYSDSANTTALHISDLEGIIKGNQLMLVSASQNVAWFATLTSLSETSYTADVRIYKDNVPYGTAKLTGTLTAGTSITGTLTGTGYGQGTFSLDISAANSQQADIATIMRDGTTTPPNWTNGRLISYSKIYITNTGATSSNDLPEGGTNFQGCFINGTVSAMTNSPLYKMQITLTQCASSDAAADGTYTGYVTTTSVSSPNDTMIVALENSTNGYSMYGEFQ